MSDAAGTVAIFRTEIFDNHSQLQHGERLTAMTMTIAGDLLVTGGHRLMKVWETKSGNMIAQTDHDSGARCLALSFKSDSRVVIFVTSDDILTIWDMDTGVQRRLRFARPQHEAKHRGAPSEVTIDSAGARVAIAYEGWPVEVWGIEERELVTMLKMRSPMGSCFNPKNGDIFGVDHDGTILHKSRKTGHEQEVDAEARMVVCSPSGTLLAACSSDGCVKLYCSASLRLLHTLRTFNESVTALAFSPDGDKLYDIKGNYCNVWMPGILLADPESHGPTPHIGPVNGTSEACSTISAPPPEGEYKYAPGAITTMVCHPSGAYICCGKDNGRVTVYDAETGSELRALYRHAPTVHIEALAWSPDGFTIASGDDTCRILVARLSSIPSQATWSCTIRLDYSLDRTLQTVLCGSYCSTMPVSGSWFRGNEEQPCTLLKTDACSGHGNTSPRKRRLSG